LTLLATGSLESGLLVSPLLGGPARHRPFAPTLHLHQRTSSRNLHLQYLAKSQSTPRCQSLITARSDHPPVLGHSGPQSSPWWVHWEHTQVANSEKKEKEKKRRKKTQASDQKPNKSQEKITWVRKISVPKARATTRHNRDKMLQNCRLLKVRQKGSTPSAKEHD
jgi:hypothetical protein